MKTKCACGLLVGCLIGATMHGVPRGADAAPAAARAPAPAAPADPAPGLIPSLPGENRSLADRFAEPPASARILKMIHAQPADSRAQDEMLRRLAAQGFGGFAGNVAFDGYVDDETKWPPFLRGVRLARAAGMALWLYDECGYPSGTARDLTLRGHPEWTARGLLVAQADSAGGAVSLALPPGKLMLAVALPRRDGAVVLGEARDLARSVADGRLAWHAPAGAWRVVAMTDAPIYEGTHAAVSLAFKNRYINLLLPEPTARFLELTHARYAERLGADLGRFFTATFTDEPSLMNLWMRPMPYRVLPWADTLPAEFQRRTGTDLLPLLPALVTEAGPRGARARYAFWDMVADLVSENFFGQVQAWCRQHNVRSGGHLLMEEGLVGHVPLYGDFFRCARRLDAPGIDCLTSLPGTVPWAIARMIADIADLEGRTVTMCEVSDHAQMYRREGDTRPVRVVTEDEIRGTCNRLLWGGINTFTSYYRFRGLTDEQLRRINLHVGRCATMLAGGTHTADVALLYPIESVWPKFVPALHGATDEPAARRIEKVFDGVGAALYAANRDFAHVDARALGAAEPCQGALVHGALRWRVLVLPATDTLPLRAWETVAAFWRTGGVVIAVGARPTNSEREWPSPPVMAIARELFGPGEGPSTATNPAGGAGILLPDTLASLVPALIDRVLERDASCPDDPTGPLRTTRRRVADHDVYFAMNDGETAWKGEITFPAPGVTERWDPATGAMTPIADGGTRVRLDLGPYAAMLFRTRAAGAPRRRDGITPATLVPKLDPLPPAQPTVGQGRHVRSKLAGDDAAGWRTDATLAKGGVDTFLFARFQYEQPPSALRAGAGLMLESVVPEGQRTPAELLVFIETRDGGRYLAGTGRRLDMPGPARAYVLFDRFKPFGGPDATTEPLDTTRVQAVLIGWGGHIGTEGEQIVVTIKSPQAFCFGDN